MTTTTEKPEIPRGEVDSSNIASIGYDATSEQLAIEFRSGAIFHYQGVKPELVSQLDEAESKGRFFVTHIKGRFAGERMTGVCPKCNDIGWVARKCTDCGTADYAPQAPRGMTE